MDDENQETVGPREYFGSEEGQEELTVKMLIERLQKYGPDNIVYVEHRLEDWDGEEPSEEGRPKRTRMEIGPTRSLYNLDGSPTLSFTRKVTKEERDRWDAEDKEREDEEVVIDTTANSEDEIARAKDVARRLSKGMLKQVREEREADEIIKDGTGKRTTH